MFHKPVIPETGVLAPTSDRHAVGAVPDLVAPAARAELADLGALGAVVVAREPDRRDRNPRPQPEPQITSSDKYD